MKFKVEFHENPIELAPLKDNAAEFFCEYTEWPRYFCHPRAYLDLIATMQDMRILMNGVVHPRNGARGVSFNDIQFYPSKNVPKGTFIAETPEVQ